MMSILDGLKRPSELATEFAKSLTRIQTTSFHDQMLEDARRAARGFNITGEIMEDVRRAAGGLDIASEILEEQRNRLLGNADHISALIEPYESATAEVTKQLRNNPLSNMFKTLHAEATKNYMFPETLATNSSEIAKLAANANTQAALIGESTAELLNQATGSYTTAIAQQQSALADAMKQIDGSSLANIFRELETSRYAELTQSDFFESFRNQESQADKTVFIDLENEIAENITTGIDVKVWSDTAKKYMAFFLKYIFFPYIMALVGAYHYDYLKSRSQTVKTEPQAQSLVNKASKKFGANALTDFRITKGSGIRLRELPNTDATIIEKLPIGKILYIIDDSQPYWLKVEVELDGNTFEGWVSKRFTKKFE